MFTSFSSTKTKEIHFIFPNQDSTENKILIRHVFEEVLNNGDLDAIDEMCASNFIGYVSGTFEPNRGPKGVKNLIIMYLNVYPDVRVDIEDQIAEGDKVVTRWRAMATHKGELMGIAPTGRQVRVMGIAISRLGGGKLLESWVSFDTLEMLRQLGVAPPFG